MITFILLGTGFVMGYLTCIVCHEVHTPHDTYTITMQPLSDIPLWVIQNQLTDIWLTLNQNQKENLFERYRDALESLDDNAVDSFVQYVREYHSL